MPVGPDLQGFAEAQRRLRSLIGVDAVFLTPAERTWPPDTPLDPETGQPYDPFLEPEVSGPDVEVTVRCGFVHRPLDTADPAETPIGTLDRGDAALIVDEADYPNVRGAKRVRVGDETWKVEAWRSDLQLTVPRYLAYLEHA